MREIKFRAWDRLRNRMSESFNLDCLHYGYFIDKEGTLEASTFYLCDCEIVQYTGLKSKNGKEIYEGDIIRWYPNSRAKSDVIIEWLRAGFGFGSWYDDDFPDTEKESIIIGNIYENPKLLKEIEG